ncbi:VRR-NUC domain-containing protein [Mailhella sp.]
MASLKELEALERQEQAAVIEWWSWCCRRFGLEPYDLLHIPNEGTGSAVRGRLQKKQGLRPGCPDLMLTAPVGAHHGLFVEMKRSRTGRPSREQLDFHARLEERGYAVAVCYGATEARVAIARYLRGEAG